MKHIPGIFTIIMLLGLVVVDPTVAETRDNNLYNYESLQLELNVHGELELVPQGGSPKLQHVTAQVLLYPRDDFRQEVTEINTLGDISNNTVTFAWDDEELGTRRYFYSALVRTLDRRNEVSTTIKFPLSSVQGYEEYLQPTSTIDSTDSAIIAQAAELAQGEDDAFKVAFKLAKWVGENVEYNLSTLTAETSQKASWVLEHREGVCDEMTSLFVAMARSLGIPAKFVSGISYTNSNLFTYPWQPHGWAEVYFPGVGWVPFDITFGEYGYVDVTHIKLRDGFDPQEPGTKFEWIARNVNLLAKNLELTVTVQNRGELQPERIALEEEILGTEVGFGSYNLVKGILKNTAPFYAATTLQLAVPPEIAIIGQNQRTILMAPKEVKETYWILKVQPGLDQDYAYDFPVIIYSEKNRSVQDLFSARQEGTSYSLEEIERLTVHDEEKTYSRKMSLQCRFPEEIKVNETQELECTLKNNGNTNLEQVHYCLGKVCEVITLLINQEKSSSITLPATTVGRNRVIVSAENEFIEKKKVVEYDVMDEPAVQLQVHAPEKSSYGERVPIVVEVQKDSFSIPWKVTLRVRGLGSESTWQVDQLLNNETARFELDGTKLTRRNRIAVTLSWEDPAGKPFSEEQTVEVAGEGRSLGQKIKMIINVFLNALAG